MGHELATLGCVPKLKLSGLISAPHLIATQFFDGFVHYIPVCGGFAWRLNNLAEDLCSRSAERFLRLLRQRIAPIGKLKFQSHCFSPRPYPRYTPPRTCGGHTAL